VALACTIAPFFFLKPPTEAASSFLKELQMHYRNGREAKNGDVVVQLGWDGKVAAVGVLHSAVAGNDYCNGQIAPVQNTVTGACMVDCLHVEDIQALLAEKGLDKRPAGK
jgi:hypothetical protein